jgi:hypothetical protein
MCSRSMLEVARHSVARRQLARFARAARPIDERAVGAQRLAG